MSDKYDTQANRANVDAANMARVTVTVDAGEYARAVGERQMLMDALTEILDACSNAHIMLSRMRAIPREPL